MNSTFLQNIDYRYNIRGWLTHINNSELIGGTSTNNDYDDIFGMELFYNQAPSTSLGFYNQPQYNGNIASVRFRTKAPEEGIYSHKPIHAYTFRYDNLNRLTGAYYSQAFWYNPTQHNQSLNLYNERISYDMMGNINTLARNGNVGNSLQAVDNLTFTYLQNGNRISAINDAAGNHLSHDFKDGITSGNEYSYDANGNPISDSNKGTTFNYNFLNLPNSISKGSDQVTYMYDATGRKLRKSSNGQTRDYIDGIEYAGNTIQFIQTEEGRIRPKKQGTRYPMNRAWAYDYFIKDHLGSVRAVTTEEVIITNYWASMELQNAAIEDQVFMNVPLTREDKPQEAPETPQFEPNNYVSFVESQNRPIEHAKALIVNEGETLNLRTEYYYNEETGDTYSTSPFTDIVTHLAYIFVLNNPEYQNLSTNEINALAQDMIINNNEVNDFVDNMLQNVNLNQDDPSAFMVYMMLDENFQIDPESSGALQAEHPNVIGELAVTELQIRRKGYLYVYVNNSSVKPVFFDNLIISHTSSKLLEENNYYPFGMLWSAPSTDNKYKYNGKEIQTELDLFTEDYGARFYDPAIGRFGTVDPMAHLRESLTPYNYCSNNPINRIDPDGALDDDITAKQNGTIEIKKTEDKFDRIFVENKSGGTELVGQFNKNENNLIKLPSTFSFKGSDGTSLGWTSHTTDSRRHISGAAAGALIGAWYETGTTDISIGQFSLADGKSAHPSTSHKLGRNGDLRPLRSDGLNAATTVFDKSFDVGRNTGLVTALHKYGWKDIISERNKSGYLLPFTSSAKERNITTDHTNHFHLQGFKPSLIYK